MRRTTGKVHANGRFERFAPEIAALIIVLAALLLPAPTGAQSDDAGSGVAPAPAPITPTGWWTKGDLIDYGVVAGSLGGFAAIHSLTPASQSGIGPSFDPAHPAAILNPIYADKIGRKHVQEDVGETVPALYVGVAVPIVGLWLGLQEGLAQGSDARHLHDTLVGLVDGMTTTLLVTEILKYEFGRLRPDFQDRAQRYYCTTQKSAEISCTGAEVPLDTDPAKADKIFADGRRSFPSGHAATSAMLATYASLVTGGHFIWGDRATSDTRLQGIALQVAAFGAAGFVWWSRVDDGRHNPFDVLTGAAIGMAMANLAYWRRFDMHGHSRRAVAATGIERVEMTPGPTPLGVGLALRF